MPSEKVIFGIVLAAVAVTAGAVGFMLGAFLAPHSMATDPTHPTNNSTTIIVEPIYHNTTTVVYHNTTVYENNTTTVFVNLTNTQNDSEDNDSGCHHDHDDHDGRGHHDGEDGRDE